MGCKINLCFVLCDCDERAANRLSEQSQLVLYNPLGLYTLTVLFVGVCRLHTSVDYTQETPYALWCGSWVFLCSHKLASPT